MEALRETLRDGDEHYRCAEFWRINWRLRAGGWAKRIVVASGVTYRDCCELVVVGCLCEECMMILMRDEARQMATFWERRLSEYLIRKKRREYAHTLELRRERNRREAAMRRAARNEVDVARRIANAPTDDSEEESEGEQ